MNANYPTWSTGNQNPAGLKFKNWMDERNMSILNPFMHMNTTNKGGRTFNTTIDLVAATQGSRVKVKGIPIASASHIALSVKTELEWRPTAERPLRYDKADWDSIKTGIKMMDQRDTSPKSVQEQLSRLVKNHTPRARPNSKAFWNKDQENMRKEIFCTWRRDRNDEGLPGLKRKFRKAIAEAKMECHSKALQEETDPECFRSVKPRTTSHPIPALERDDSTVAAEHQHMADEIQKALYQGEHYRTPTTIKSTAQDLHIGILDRALKATPNGAATGPDRIPARAVKALRNENEKLFLDMMNRAWQEGIPNSWKESTTILIPKAKKPTYTKAKNWRPIQLQSILAKVLERAVAIKLDELDILPPNMYGGRSKNGTTDAIQALDNMITITKLKYTCLTALDIEGGFDHLQLQNVCETLSKKNEHLAQWIKHWGHSRVTSYRFNGRNSRAYATGRGTPQGSPLSPILYLISAIDIMETEVEKPLGTTTHILSYVDDIMIATCYNNKTNGTTAHQKTIDRLNRKAGEAGYNFAQAKAEHIHIKTPKSQRISPQLKGSDIPGREKMRWLGYFITPNWTWTEHLSEWTTRATYSGHRLRALTSRYQIGGLNAWCTHRLITGLIMPQLTYGIETWGNKTMIREAQNALNNIIRKTFGIEKKCNLLLSIARFPEGDPAIL